MEWDYLYMYKISHSKRTVKPLGDVCRCFQKQGDIFVQQFYLYMLCIYGAEKRVSQKNIRTPKKYAMKRRVFCGNHETIFKTEKWL